MPDIFNSQGKTLDHKKVVKSAQGGEFPKSRLSPEQIKRLEKEKEGQMVQIPPGINIHKLSGHTHNPLAAYCLYPDHIKFINADREEKIVLLLRRHPITNLPWIVLSFIMIIAPFFASVFSVFIVLPAGIQIVATLCWYLITTAFVLEEFLSWFFNVNLITDERIFDVDFLNLMYREITEADLDQIQDVSVEVGGALRTFFGFGNVWIQTAAQVPRIEFEAVPHPDKVAKVLRELGIQEEIEKIEGRIR